MRFKVSLLYKVFGVVSVIALTAFTSAQASLNPVERLLDGVLPLPIQLLTPVEWEPSPSPSVKGYAVYCLYTVADIPLSLRIDAGAALSATLPLTIGTEYIIYAVAYDSEGLEGIPSEPIIHTPPLLAGLKLSKSSSGPVRVQFRTSPLAVCRIDYTSQMDAPDWKFLTLTTADMQGNATVYDFSSAGQSSRFYRVIRL
jgi:hypothetical protein